MAAFKVQLKIDQGASFSKLVTWKTGPSRTPVDLTGCTALAQVRTTLESATALHSFDTTNGSILLGGAAGTVELVMTDEQTAAALWKSGVYDLVITFPNGSKRRLMYGAVTISPGVTRG